MKKFPTAIKSFLKEFRAPDGYIADLLKEDSYHDIPNVPGAYIITSKSQKFLYPNGESKVIYIGQSKTLKRRIRGHRKKANELINSSKKERAEFISYSRFQYMASFGAQVYWYCSLPKESSGDLEKLFLDYFYDRYLAIPVTNGANSYK